MPTAHHSDNHTRFQVREKAPELQEPGWPQTHTEQEINTCSSMSLPPLFWIGHKQILFSVKKKWSCIIISNSHNLCKREQIFEPGVVWFVLTLRCLRLRCFTYINLKTMNPELIPWVWVMPALKWRGGSDSEHRHIDNQEPSSSTSFFLFYFINLSFRGKISFSGTSKWFVVLSVHL